MMSIIGKFSIETKETNIVNYTDNTTQAQLVDDLSVDSTNPVLMNKYGEIVQLVSCQDPDIDQIFLSCKSIWIGVKEIPRLLLDALTTLKSPDSKRLYRQVITKYYKEYIDNLGSSTHTIVLNDLWPIINTYITIYYTKNKNTNFWIFDLLRCLDGSNKERVVEIELSIDLPLNIFEDKHVSFKKKNNFIEKAKCQLIMDWNYPLYLEDIFNISDMLDISVIRFMSHILNIIKSWTSKQVLSKYNQMWEDNFIKQLLSTEIIRE